MNTAAMRDDDPIAPTPLNRLHQVRKTDLHADVTAELARLAARLSPGDRFPTERELAERLGVGRSTVRESVKALQLVGALHAIQGAGLMVGSTHPDEVARVLGWGLIFQRPSVREVIVARRLSEIEIAGLAAVHASQADMERMRAAVEAAATHAEDRAIVAEADVEFHVALAQASRNIVLQFLAAGMRTLVEIWMANAIRSRDIVDGLVAEHRRILECVEARDAEAARTAMASHLDRASERLMMVVDLDAPMERFADEVLRERIS
jgi:GntR family transcriptional regulator, transcriptional repressor for pyruvate dehydrogenase complex